MDHIDLIAARMERARAERGIPVAELARRVGIDRKRPWRVLNGERAMRADEFVRLCAFFGMGIFRPQSKAKQEAYSVYTVPGIALGRPAWRRFRSSRRRAGTRPFPRNETPWTGAAGAQPACGSATLHAGDTPRPWA